MKESIKKKFDSIDQSKIKVESTKELLGKIEKKLNSKTQENVDKAEALLDKFIAQAKAKNADIFVSSKPAPNLTPTQKKKATQVVKNKLDALMDTIANDPLLKDFNNSRRVKGGGKSDPLIDSERKARESGRRVSKKGWKNQYGASNGGRRYYEYRENRIDRKAPNYGSRPWLEDGGMVHPSNSMHEKFMVVEIMEDGSRKVHNKFPDMESAMMFGALKRNFLKKGSQLIIEDENGKQVYRSFKSGGKIDESTAMVLSQNKEIAHHTEELKEALKKNPEVEPWVIGKIERASTDMSDITHYLDGKTEYAKGGVLDAGTYKIGNPVKDEDGFYAQKVVDIGDYGQVAIANVYRRNLSDYSSLNYPVITKKQLNAHEIIAEGAYQKSYRENRGDYYKDKEAFENSIRNNMKQDKYADGGYMADGGSLLKSGYFAYPSGDGGDELGVFYDKQSMINFAVANKDKYGKLIFEGIEDGDILEVNKDDSKDVITWLFSRIGMNTKEANKKIKMWFISNYPEEEEQIDERVTFDDIWFDLKNQRNIYYALGNRFVIREVFEKIATIYGVEYDFIEKMYKRESYAKGGKIVDQYDGRTPEDIWNNLTKSQRQHFLYDHRSDIEAYRGDEELKSKQIVEAYNSDWKELDKDIKNRFANHTREGEYAKGGMMADGGKVRWQDVFAGDNALVIAENKMGVVIKPYGRRFHLRFPDGSEKTYSAEELEFFKDDEFAKGGEVGDFFYDSRKDKAFQVIFEDGDKIGIQYLGMDKKPVGGVTTITKNEFEYNVEKGSWGKWKQEYAKGGKIKVGDTIYKAWFKSPNNSSEKFYKVYVNAKSKVEAENKAKLIDGENFVHVSTPQTIFGQYQIRDIKSDNTAIYAKGGYTKRRDVKLIVIKNPNKKGTKDYLTIDKKDFLNGLNKFEEGGKLTKDYTYIKRSDVDQVAYYDEKGKTQIDFKPQNGFWVSKKALVDAGMNETKAKFDAKEVANEIIALSNKAWDTLSIESGSEIYASDSLQENLADEYYKLGIDKIYKKLTKPERKKVSDILTDENEHSLRNYLALRGFNGEAEYKNYAKMYEDTYAKFGYRSNWNPKNVDVSLGVVSGIYAKGGDIGFEKLANKVAKNYEGDKVKPKYQKEYGKTYDKAEAKEVGNKVAAKVYRQQLAKMEHGGKLPEDLGRYFIKTRSTKVIKMADLIPLRARPTGIANAEKYMKMAYDGEMEKRKPITIYKSQRKYRVLDGNSTYAVAKANGWENIWAEVVKNPNMKNVVKRTDDIFSRAKSIRKEGESWQDALQRAKSMK
jgi:cell fate (sporulation/competence/biofilm development) regulator YmcA (YheA/YmcA/DUF963 family)